MELTINLDTKDSRNKGVLSAMFFKINAGKDLERVAYIDDEGRVVIQNRTDIAITLFDWFFKFMKNKDIKELTLYPGDKISFTLDITAIYDKYIEMYPDTFYIGISAGIKEQVAKEEEKENPKAAIIDHLVEDLPDKVSISDLADLLKLSRGTIHRHIKQSKVPTIRQGKMLVIKKSDVIKFLRKQNNI